MDILKAIADNPSLLDAVRKTIEAEFSLDNLDTTHANELLGEKVRARIEGLARVQEAFKKINRYKSNPDKPDKVNRAI